MRSRGREEEGGEDKNIEKHKAQIRQTTRKGKKANTHTRIRKQTKTQQKNTNENVHSITTSKKRQQKQRSRFLQEYKSETSYTPEDGHVGRNM
jgi:hypothetical protein